MGKVKNKKVLVYLNANEEVIQEINDSGVMIEYLEDTPRYEIKFNYLFGKLIGLTKKDLLTNTIKKISLFKIAFQKISYITEYNSNRKYATINDDRDETVRSLLEEFIIV